ncbi:MAG: DUF559 domain-containing protein [Bacteroidetes bacterium]|nr:DUF559 domain-containing protein [Bacteroidota bacterium]
MLRFTQLFFLSLCFLFSAPCSFSQNIDALLSRSENVLKTNSDSALNYAFLAAEASHRQKDTLHIAKSYQKIGLIYDDMDDADKEVFYFRKAYEAAKNISDAHLKMEITVNVAEAFFDKGNYDESFLWFKKAKSLSGELKDNGLLYRIYSGIGHIFTRKELRNLDSAEIYYTLSRAFALFAKDTSNIADYYRSMNEVYAGRKQYGKSVEYSTKALELFSAIKDSDGIAQVYTDMGDVFYYTKENKKSIDYYTKAYEIQKKKNAVSAISVGAVNLAYMYAMEGRKDLLDSYGKEAYSLALKTKSWERVKYAVEWLGEAYEKTGNNAKALFYFKKLMSVKDSITNRSAIEKNSREELQGAFEEKMKLLKLEEDKRKAIAEEKEHNQKIVTTILIIGILIALTLLFLAFRSYIAKKKANIIISRQKEEAEAQKQKIEEINKEITDSINYAKIIQRSILPDPDEIMKVFPESFGLYKPKSVVSGDIYWFHAAPPPPEGGNTEGFGYETADPMMYKLLKEFVTTHRNVPTEAENVFWQLVREKNTGYKFRRQHIIGEYIADFVCLQQKLIVEIDGLIHALPEHKRNDEQRTQYLNTMGFHVLRFTNNEVIGNPDGVIDKLIKTIQSRAASQVFPPSGGGGAVFIAAVDCTGHGVPGALMSMIAIEKLNEAVAKNIFSPAEILSHLNRGVKSSLRQKEGSVSKDGMDIALVRFEKPPLPPKGGNTGAQSPPFGGIKGGLGVLYFSGAMRPLWLFRNNELTEYKPTKHSIGGITPEAQQFIEHEIQLQKGDTIYIFSDGYADQFGGEKGKKLMSKNMKELLLSIQRAPMAEQEKILNDKLTQWQGAFEQVDDVLVIGIRI